MRRALPLAIAAVGGLLMAGPAPASLAGSAGTVTTMSASVAFGADLSQPVTGQRTCWGGISAATLPTLAAQQGMTLEQYVAVLTNLYGVNFAYPSCSWWNVGSIPRTGRAGVSPTDNVVPYPGGTLTSVRVKTGPVVGRMRIDVLRYIRDATSAAGAGGPFWVASSEVFTPAPNTITEVPLNIAVKHELNEISMAWTYDALALSVLEPNVPVPFWDAGGDPYTNGGVGAKYPAWEPGTEQYQDAGALDIAGTVLLQGSVVLGGTETPPPEATTSAPPEQNTTPTAPVPTVRVKATGGRSKLRVDVDPNRGGKYWTFGVQKLLADGTWKQLKSYRTKSSKETRTVNLPKGTYRVTLDPQFGYAAATSPPIALRR